MDHHRLFSAMALVSGALLLAAGCGSPESSGESTPRRAEASGPEKSPGPPAITAADRQQAEQLFATRCATCHGPDAHGDGPGAAALDPKPRDFHDPEWQQATSDETIEKAIVYGGAAVGKSIAMAPNPDLQSKPGVVAALREKVRAFGDS